MHIFFVKCVFSSCIWVLFWYLEPTVFRWIWLVPFSYIVLLQSFHSYVLTRSCLDAGLRGNERGPEKAFIGKISFSTVYYTHYTRLANKTADKWAQRYQKQFEYCNQNNLLLVDYTRRTCKWVMKQSWEQRKTAEKLYIFDHTPKRKQFTFFRHLLISRSQ